MSISGALQAVASMDSGALAAVLADMLLTLVVSLLDIGDGSYGKAVPFLVRPLPGFGSVNQPGVLAVAPGMVLHNSHNYRGWTLKFQEDSLARRRLRRDLGSDPAICNHGGPYECTCGTDYCEGAQAANTCCISVFSTETLNASVSILLHNASQVVYDADFDRDLRTAVAGAVDEWCARGGCGLPTARTFQARHVVVYAVAVTNTSLSSTEGRGPTPSLEVSLFVIVPSSGLMTTTEPSIDSTAADTSSDSTVTEGAVSLLSPEVLSAQVLHTMFQNQSSEIGALLGLSVSLSPTEQPTDHDDDDDDELPISMAMLVFLSTSGILFVMTCCISAVKAVRDRSKMKKRNRQRQEERKKLASIEREAAGGSGVVKNGVAKKPKGKVTKNGVHVGKKTPMVTVSEQVIEATVHNGPDSLPNGTTTVPVVTDTHKQNGGSPLVVPALKQNGGPVKENGHVLQEETESPSGSSLPESANHCSDGKKQVEAEDISLNSVEMQAPSITETERVKHPSGGSGNRDIDANQNDAAVAAPEEDGLQAAVGEQNDAAISDTQSAVSVGEVEAVRSSERPDRIDIAPDVSIPAKSPGEDNPAFEATSP